MPKQVKWPDIVQSDIKDSVRDFIEAEYKQRNAKGVLPAARNRHEGYGLLAEDFVALRVAVDEVTLMMKDTLKALTVDDSAFHATADGVYGAALDLAIAAVTLGVSAVNVSCNMSHFAIDPTPIDELLKAGGDGLE